MRLSFVSPHLIHRAKILSKFVSVQLVVQALGLGSGILLVRTFSKEEYAYFTLANSMQSAMNLLADSGVGSALLALGGKVWQDRQRFGQLINTALRVRLYLSIISVAVVTPILIWMLVSNGASIIYAIALAIVVIIGFNFQLNAGVLLVVPKLNLQIERMQNLDLISAVSRLIFLLIAYFTFLNAAVAVAIASLSFGLRNVLLRCWIVRSINLQASYNKQDEREILKVVKYQAPNTIFYCFQGQITVWLISLFGNVQSIAEVGALSRLGIIFSLMTSIMDSIILPRFSRCQSVNVLGKRYFQILGSYGLFAGMLVGVTFCFPKQFLWILGNQYSYLESEFTLIIISILIQSFASVLWSINTAKAWVHYSYLFIPTIIIAQIFLLLFLDISNTKGVIIFSFLSIIPTLFLNFYMTYDGIKRSVFIDPVGTNI